jgi:uncharacterized coiled-coil protein SlyX
MGDATQATRREHRVTLLRRLRAWLDAHTRCRELDRQLAAQDACITTLRQALARKRETEWHRDRALEAKLDARLK